MPVPVTPDTFSKLASGPSGATIGVSMGASPAVVRKRTRKAEVPRVDKAIDPEPEGSGTTTSASSTAAAMAATPTTKSDVIDCGTSARRHR